MPTREIEDHEPLNGVEQLTPLPLQTFTCERCGFTYQKTKDYKPYLCYRCLKFLGKGVFRLYHQLQPPTSRTVTPVE